MGSQNLYGAPRPKSKANPISLSSTSIHALANELTLARARLSSSASNTSTKTAPGRPRPSKTAALFAPANKGVSKRAARDEAADDSYGGKTSAQLGDAVSERELARSRKKMKEKSRLYAAMKRGDFADEGGEGLVDFDRKWAEHPSDESDEEEEGRGSGGDDDDEIIEYEDEFGRTRKGKRGDVEREKRRVAAAKRAAEEAVAMNRAPEGLIVGNMIQTAAFTTATFSAVPSSAMLAGAMPKEEEERKLHYDASKEVRTKGVGFYQFSKDEGERMAELEELEKERLRTAEERKNVEERRKKRKEAVEKKREEVKRRRREKVGDKWLEGFMGELAESPAASASADQGEGGEES